MPIPHRSTATTTIFGHLTLRGQFPEARGLRSAQKHKLSRLKGLDRELPNRVLRSMNTCL
jgi:hypothetical protein